MLISGASRQKYGKLKDELANDYLLGSDHYPDTLEKAGRILANYQNTRASAPYRASANETGVAFMQHGGRGGRGAGRGGQEGRGAKTEGKSGSGDSSGGGGDDLSTITGCTSGDGAKTNSKGESHCFNCGSLSHWAYECPQLSGEQQSQLHMNLESHKETTQEAAKDAHQLLNVTFAQGAELPDSRVYLDGCSTVTAFKSDKYLKEPQGVRINCNAGAITTNKRGTYGNLKVWHLPDGIANIIFMHELEENYRITYDSWARYYVVHTPKGEVRFYKDEQGLPYLDLEESSEAAVLLLQQGEDLYTDTTRIEAKAVVALMKTVQGNYEGYTKGEVLKAKEARRAQAMMGNPSKKDYTTMVSNNLIPECPITSTDSHIWPRSPEHTRKNGADNAYASGGGLCGSPTKPSGCEQGHNVGSRRIFC